MKMPIGSIRGRSLIAAVAVFGTTSTFAAWSASGTVKSTTGTALAGVAVTVLDSSANLKATTDASGNFTIGSSTGILEPATRAFAGQVIGNELVVSSSNDGAIELALVDASGRSLWTSTAMAAQGTAHAALPTGIGHGAVFLRLRSAEAVQYQAVIMGPAGLRLAMPAARSLATYPVLTFHLTGYDDTTYTMTMASQTGIMVVMAAPSTTTCPFPTTFKWKDYGGPLATPANGLDAIKDFTNVTMSNGQHLIYSSDVNSGGNYGSEGFAPFTNWSDAATTKQTTMSTGTVAPELMYFTPKKEWILSYQWGSAKFNYMTSQDPTNANGWSGGGALLSENITGGSSAPIDHVPICDATNCYLFYAGDNGHIYRGSMPIGNYPGVFSGTTSILSDAVGNLFEAVEVYTVKGTGKYLMIVECEGSVGRYFRAFSATSLGGTFTSITNGESSPFAGASNVTYTNKWSTSVSHGDMVRGYDETRTIDPCNLQLLYQGVASQSGSYNLIPWKLGLLTFTGS
jgi:hypothetical protein